MADVVFNTSGSTGDAKCIIRTEESLKMDASSIVASFPDIWSSRPAVVASVRPEHMYGALWRVRVPAVAGSVVDPAIIMSVEELASACQRHGRIVFVTTPSFLEKALGHPEFENLKGAFVAIVTSGSLLRSETALAVAQKLDCCPTEIFGSTETGTVAYRRQTQCELWTVMDNVEVSTLPDGRLVVDSPCAMERAYVMGDIVKLETPRTFRLIGRANRRVKILERYVSISDVESEFLAHPFVSRVRVEATADAVPRLGALIVLSEQGIEALSKTSYGEVASRFRRDLSKKIGSFAFPRRIRFVRQLPVNEQGKTMVQAVRAMLGNWSEEPVVLSWRATDDMLLAQLVFPPDLKCFRGHFPSFSVLPGVAQLYFLMYFGRQAFPDFPETVTYKRLKFQKAILPCCEVKLEVTRRESGSFGFSISSSTGLYSSGIIERSVQ